MLWLDFETRSCCDLNRCGAYNYARDLTTEIICMSYAFDDDEFITWWPSNPFPESVAQYTGQIRAHNASFERLMFWYVLCPTYNVPEPALERFYCTAAQARANCMPGSLEDAGRFISSNMRKDSKGKRLINLLSKPLADGTFNKDAALLLDMGAYCEQDCRTMRSISKGIRELTADELYDYHVNERINDQGILIDRKLAEAAINYAAQEAEELNQQIYRLTNGEFLTARSNKLVHYLAPRLSDKMQSFLQVRNKKGDITLSLSKAVRDNLITYAEENPGEITPETEEILRCTDNARASSIAKFKRLVDLADRDDRVRGCFIFGGGSATGRASSEGAQLQNFPRKALKNSAQVREAFINSEPLVPAYGNSVADVLRGMLRPTIIPSANHVLFVADWSSIEARVNPWLSDCPSGYEKLDLFASGVDVYKVNAASTFNLTTTGNPDITQVTDTQRQIGKVQELSCGFAGGIGAFAAMGKNYGIYLDPEIAQQMVNAWRLANPWAIRYWNQLEKGYKTALKNPGVEIQAARITYLFDGAHLWYALPSGRILNYPFMRMEGQNISYAKAKFKPKSDASEWPRANFWRGIACENTTQATAHDILRHALRGLEHANIKAIAHIHDECVFECHIKDVDNTKKIIEEIMCTPPDWAKDLPLSIEIKIMERYGK